MTLLTPNFADKVKTDQHPQGGNGLDTPHVVAAHEPLKNEPVNLPSPYPPPKFSLAPEPAAVAEPAPLKIACIGTAPSSRMLAPFADPSWKIWGCSPGNQGQLPRVDAWFEIHANLLWPECVSYGRPYIEWLKQQKFPIYMQDNSLVPNATPFPMKEMVEEFGPYFFTSSFTWMMALGIKMGAKEIALYGIDMASREEYIIQRPGAYYFFMEAAKRGIKIWAPYESDIMQPPGLYGYSDVTQFGRKTLARRTEVGQRVTALRQQKEATIAQMNRDLAYLEGALEDIDYFVSIHLGAQDNAGTGYLDKLLEKSKVQNGQG